MNEGGAHAMGDEVEEGEGSEGGSHMLTWAYNGVLNG